MMASLRIVGLALLICLGLLAALGVSQQCEPLRNGPLETCAITGYNYTFPIPSDLSEKSKMWIARSVRFVTNAMKNCSVVAIAETMVCSFFAPNCRNGNPNQFLPCRRVCSEFLKRCESTIPDYFVDMLVGICTLLPNSTHNEGQCYEPPGFINHYNASSLGPLERSCEPVVFPFCKDAGYTHTLITQERQKTIYYHVYDKNYTEGSADLAIPAPNSLMQHILYQLGNYSECSTNLKKTLCGRYIPPCFKDEGLAFYTVCQHICADIATKCPAVLDEDHLFIYCDRMAVGNDSAHGFCKHTSWPPPMKWNDFFKDTPESSKKVGIGAGIIAVAVILPVIIVGVVIAIVFFYKKRRLSSQGYSKQEDDRNDLVT